MMKTSPNKAEYKRLGEEAPVLVTRVTSMYTLHTIQLRAVLNIYCKRFTRLKVFYRCIKISATLGSCHVPVATRGAPPALWRPAHARPVRASVSRLRPSPQARVHSRLPLAARLLAALAPTPDTDPHHTPHDRISPSD